MKSNIKTAYATRAVTMSFRNTNRCFYLLTLLTFYLPSMTNLEPLYSRACSDVIEITKLRLYEGNAEI